VFVNGISQDLLADLSLQPGLTVLSAQATFHLAGARGNLHEAVVDLGADYLVRGSVAKRDGDIVLNVRLVETRSGRTLWSNALRAPESAIFEIQREAANGISQVLGGRTTGDFAFVNRHGTTETLAAYDEFLQGRAAYMRMTPEDNALARAHFERAAALDPEFARAHAGLALTWLREVIDGWSADPDQTLREASRHVALAEAIDPDVPQIYFVKGMVALFHGEHLAAAEAAHQATELDPNYADAYGLLAWVLLYGGRADVAVEALHQALRLNPLSSASFEAVAGEINFATGRYDEAVACFRNALERNPTHSRARLWLAVSLAQTGQMDDARWELDELLAINPDLSFENSAFGFPHKDPELLSRFFRTVGRIRLLD
jgi:adenylate cyclase